MFFLTLHLKLSSFFNQTQLIDQYNYTSLINHEKIFEKKNSVNVYHFFNFITLNRVLFFNLCNQQDTISNIFFGSNWLERESSELFGVTFFNKKDKRNLMLCYGDTSAPFSKSVPSIGFIELFFNVFVDTLVFNKITMQN